MSTKLTGLASSSKTLSERSKFVKRVNAMHARAEANGLASDPRYADAVDAFLTGVSELPAFKPTF